MFGTSLYWRETMKPARFLIFDGRVVLVILPAFMHLRFWTLIIAIATMFTFWWFDRKGVSADSILRFLRARIIGPKRSARGVFEERTAVDFSFECKKYLERSEFEARKAAAPARTSLLARFGFSPKARGHKGNADD